MYDVHGIWSLWNFFSVFLMIFGLFMILAGVFTAYFGSGKSRAIGAALLVVGLIIGVMLFMLTTQYGGDLAILNEEVSFGTIALETLGYIVASVIGALVALGIFLVAIMKA